MKKYIAAAATYLLPALAFAQGGLSNLDSLITSIGTLVSTATPIVVGLALLAFFWGLAKYIFSAGDEGARDKGKEIMIWGIVALFVMISVWGIVNFIGTSLGLDNTGPTIPTAI